MPRGGKRPGAGKPKGYKAPETLQKLAEREIVRKMVSERLSPMTEAQIDSAEGIKHFMLRDGKTGKFERLTDPEQIVKALNTADAEAYWIYTKDPSPGAYAYLLNQAIGAPTQHVEMEVSGNIGIDERLKKGRERVAALGKR